MKVSGRVPCSPNLHSEDSYQRKNKRCRTFLHACFKGLQQFKGS